MILLRHGESEWNLANRFTGWVDVDLSDKGRAEAKRGGQQMKEEGGEDYIHQNCSGCIVPHRAKYIKKNFNRNWFEVMKDVR